MSEQLPPDNANGTREGGLPPDAAGHCYLATWQFDARMGEAARRLMRTHGTVIERHAWWIMFAVYVSAVIASIWLMPQVPLSGIGGLVFVLLIYLNVHAKRFQARIVSERLCLRCGYPLLTSPVDDRGFGRCPECGRRFNSGEYRRPPRGYRRMEADLREVLRSSDRSAETSSSEPSGPP